MRIHRDEQGAVMELIERYLKTLKSGLPEAQREDIVREFSENLYAEVAEKESELGRGLTSAEIDAILQQHGNPLVIASRFREDQRSVAFGRQIIGPTLFPFYMRVLSFNLGLTAIVVLIIFAALLASGQAVGVSQILSTLFYQLLIQFAIATLIFALIDRQMAKNPNRWDPSFPNKYHFPGLGASRPDRISRVESVSQIIGLAVFIAWLRVVRGVPFLIFGPAAAYMKAAPVWHQIYPALVLIALVSMAQAVANLLRPEWIMLRALSRVAVGTGSLVVYLFLLKAGSWVVATTNLSGYQQAVGIINQVIFYSLWVGAIVTAIVLMRDVWRLGRCSFGRSPQKAAVNS